MKSMRAARSWAPRPESRRSVPSVAGISCTTFTDGTHGGGRPAGRPGLLEQARRDRRRVQGRPLFTGDVGFIDDDGWFFIGGPQERRHHRQRLQGVAARRGGRPLRSRGGARGSRRGVPDDYCGESVKAFVSLKPGASAWSLELAPEATNGQAPDTGKNRRSGRLAPLHLLRQRPTCHSRRRAPRRTGHRNEGLPALVAQGHRVGR